MKKTSVKSTDKGMQIINRQVDELIPYINNAKLHPDEQILKIAASIQEFGFINPVIIDKENSIIAGHGCLMAAKKIGMAEVPCLMAEHLTKAQIKAYRLADNKLNDGGYDNELLTVELESLKLDGFNIELTGFEIDLAGLSDEENGDNERPDDNSDSVKIAQHETKTDHCSEQSGAEDTTGETLATKVKKVVKEDAGFTCPKCGFEYTRGD